MVEFGFLLTTCSPRWEAFSRELQKLLFGGLKLNKRSFVFDFDLGRLLNISKLHLSQVERLLIPRTLLPIVKDKFRDALWVCILPAEP